MRITFVIALVLSTIPLTAAATSDSYLCIAENSSGFKFENGSWQNSFFNPKNKYIFRPLRDSDGQGKTYFYFDTNKPTHVLTRFGDKMGSGCFTPDKENGFYYCKGFEEFKFNIKNKRYVHTYLSISIADIDTLSEYEKNKEPISTPLMELGSCEKM